MGCGTFKSNEKYVEERERGTFGLRLGQIFASLALKGKPSSLLSDTVKSMRFSRYSMDNLSYYMKEYSSLSCDGSL